MYSILIKFKNGVKQNAIGLVRKDPFQVLKVLILGHLPVSSQ